MIGGGAFLVNFHRFYGIPARIYFRAAGVPAVLALAAGIPIAGWLLLSDITFDGRLPAFAGAFGCLIVYLATYWPLATRANILPERLNLRLMRLSRA